MVVFNCKINNIETKYYVEGTDIIIEKTGDNVLYFIHNDIDGLVGFKYNEDLYYYDKETKLYYLNSRYYNPMWGRFINADGIINSNRDVIGYNLYVYCSNDPINNVDSSGKGWLKNLAKKIVKKVKKVVKKVVKLVQRVVIGTASKVAGIIYPNASKLLTHSLQDNPKDLNYNKNSQLSKKIQSSNEFKSQINALVADNPNANFKKEKISIHFDNPDLHLAIKKADIYVSGQLNNGKGNLSILIEDDYDFKYEKVEGNTSTWYVVAINNMAWCAQEIGTIGNYHIKVKFDYCVNCE